MTSTRRKPLSVPLVDVESAVVIKEEDSEQVSTPTQLPRRTSKRRSVFTWFCLSVLGVIAFILGFDLWLFTNELVEIHPVLGYSVLALAISATLCLLYMIGKEFFALRKLAAMTAVLEQAEQAFAFDDEKLAQKSFRQLQVHYGKVPELAVANAELRKHQNEGYSGIELLTIAERSLLEAIDKKAVSLINAQARNTALLTTISPYAILDVLITAWRNLRLIRQLSELYGAKPSFFGSMKLMEQVVAHIAVTGGMEAGDSLISELFGGSFLTKLSTKLGEALINGLLTARVGLTAMSQVRPLPFNALPKPSVKHVAKDIVKEFKDRLV
jgi:putative membrane protein